MIASFDIDGVIFMGWDLPGVYPGPNDIIITGRSFEEREETLVMLKERGIKQIPFFNPLSYEAKTRESSGLHKSAILNMLLKEGLDIKIHYEDDPIQAEIIRNMVDIYVVELRHELINKENERHIFDNIKIVK